MQACLCSAQGEDAIACPPRQLFTADAGCICVMESADCPIHKILNGDLCKCECISPTPLLCSKNEFFDEETCRCVCNYEGCSSLSEPSDSDNLTCGCFDLTNSSCPTLSHFNEETCACDCDERVECRFPMQFSNETCRCECQPLLTCSPNKTLSAETCTCECIAREKCPTGFTWNADVCSCKCIARKCPREWNLNHTYVPMNPISCQNARSAEECRYLRCNNSERQCTWV